MSLIQLTAEPENSGKKRQPLVAAPAADSGHITVNLIIQTLNEAARLAQVVPAVPDLRDALVILDGGSTMSVAR